MTKFKLTFDSDPEDDARIAQSQRDYARRIADALEHSDPLNGDPLAGIFAAGILRQWADNLPDAQPRHVGTPRQHDHGHIALVFAMLRSQGVGVNAAKKKVAEEFGIGESTVRDVLKEKQKDAEAMVAFFNRNGSVHPKKARR